VASVPEPPKPASPTKTTPLAPVIVEHGRGSVVATGDHGSAVIPVTARDPQWGDFTAPVTIVEFADFECTFSGRVRATILELQRTYGPRDLRVVWKHHPLPFHKAARPAAEAAATVFGLRGSEAFWKFYDLAIPHRQNLTAENFVAWAAEVGIPRDEFQRALEKGELVPKIDEDMALARDLTTSGTPSFRINGVLVSGAQPIDKFKEVIDQQLSEAEKSIASGTRPEDVYVVMTNRNLGEIQPKEDVRRRPPLPLPAVAAVPDDGTLWKVPVYADDPVRGPKDALVTIVEFADFQCPFSKRVRATLAEVMKRYPNDVRLVWKDLPLPFHPRAKPAAMLARRAYELGGNARFWQAHDALFDSQPKLESADLEAIAPRVGLSWAAVESAIEKNENAKLEQSMQLAATLSAKGTPRFFINGRQLSGAQPVETFQRVIDEQLARAKALVEKRKKRAGLYDALVETGRGPEIPDRKTAPPVDARSAWKGGANAPVVIQEWADFQCPFSKRVTSTLRDLQREFQDKIKIVWRHLPLPFHKQARLAAEASEEVLEQVGRAAFWRYHDALFEAQRTPDGLERPNLEKLAAQVGANLERFRAALDSGKHRAKVQADVDLAQETGISGTPAFLIGDSYVSGAQPFPTFQNHVRLALDEAKKRAK
jgi:protein-disulfide isomerase